MTTIPFSARRPQIATAVSTLLLSVMLAACGGGGGDSSSSPNTRQNTSPTSGSQSPTDTSTPPVSGVSSEPAPLDASIPMTMSCVEGAGYQCSGDTIFRIDNDIALTRSGVQVRGKSTSDLANPIVDVTTASGLALASQGTAQVRARKNAGAISNVALLLDKFGLSWDGVQERPVIIETFNTTAGRVSLGSDGSLISSALHDSSDISFYDYATKGVNATQANYANNRYFPRATPSRCPAGSNCATTETTGIQQVEAGNWQAGGTTPDRITAGRLHEDGDVHAGNGQPDANNNPTILPGGNGFSVPYPGSKGYRTYDGWNFAYANLGAWMTQDTIEIAEWVQNHVEHNTNRRGAVAFGEVTDPSTVPTSGTASYSGMAYGWYAATASSDAQAFRATVTVTVDFAKRAVAVSLQNATTTDTHAAVPLNFNSSVVMGAAGQSVANYFNSHIQTNGLDGGVGGRFFGPVAGNAPPELGGTFSFSNVAGQVTIGGFIAKKQ